jgi:serine/threonine protein kinase
MTGLEHYVGQVLDEKYRLERLLGQGGMGAVYLATHLGTERFVALKLIAPDFMRNEEFVERFKREARAAGRLRHPNVVDVTDFGFARTGAERVAYLVMEYLDGCTLGDVLAEEQRLPLEWVVDILEQVSSAVHEAHQQGIVHRDLKPDNIWLEPNRLGGYRVKVLDFGIAKLAEADAGSTTTEAAQLPASTTAFAAAAQASANDAARPSPRVGTNLETDTLIYTDGRVEQQAEQHEPNNTHADERVPAAARLANETDDTQLFIAAPKSSRAQATNAAPPPPTTGETDDGDQTRMLAQGTVRKGAAQQTAAVGATVQGAGLTRVGSIMGTPLYMSPEQCRGEYLDARADIYSLGVIAYQMLNGAPPFTGDMMTVMREHMESAPPALRERNRKVPKRVARVVMSALAKDPAARPQTAAAFSNSLRANADSISSLYRRAIALYSEYFPKFIKMSLIAHLPVILLTLLLVGLELGKRSLSPVFFTVTTVVLSLAQLIAYFLAASAISGMTALIVAQLYVAPLRPVQLNNALAVLRRRWRPFLKTSVRVTLRIVIGMCLFFIPGLIMSIRYLLYAPVVLMEGLEKKAAMRRARELAARSWRTVIIVALLQFLIPMVVGALLGRFGVHREVHNGAHVGFTTGPSSQIGQHLTGLINIFVVPLMSIVPALLYLKMRQMGGETLSETITQIEEVEAARSQWQRRMRTRLSLNTPQNRTPS